MRHLLLFFVFLGQLFGAEGAVPGKAEEESFAGKVVQIDIGEKDLSDGQSFKFWERVLERVAEEKAKAVIFNLNTPGGLAFPTKEFMSQIANLEMPTYTFIDPMAMSAGALIAISTDEIYMAPGSLVGSAALVNGSGMEMGDHMRAKIESFFNAHVRWITEKKGHRYEVIEAMMMIRNKERQIGSQIVPKGELLALTSSEAIEAMDEGTLFAVAEVKDIESLLKLKGLSNDEVVTASPTGFERIAWWVASVSGVLILIGLGGGYLEMKTPGFGIGGVISLIAFSIFFFGNYLAGNMAGYELVAIFVVGLALIAVEIFIIPGFGVAGITGLVMVVGSLAFAMVDKVQWQNREWNGEGMLAALEGPALHLAGGILGSLIVLYFVMRYLPDLPFFNRIQMKEALPSGTGVTIANHVGEVGEAFTDLRPAGKMMIGDQVFDVVAEGDFVSKGDSVEVIKEDGMGMSVRRT